MKLEDNLLRAERGGYTLKTIWKPDYLANFSIKKKKKKETRTTVRRIRISGF